MPEMSIHISNEPLHKVTNSKYPDMFIDFFGGDIKFSSSGKTLDGCK